MRYLEILEQDQIINIIWSQTVTINVQFYNNNNNIFIHIKFSYFFFL